MDVAILHNVPKELRAGVLDVLVVAFQERGHTCEVLEADRLDAQVSDERVIVRRPNGSELRPDAVFSRIVSSAPLRTLLYAMAARGATVVNSPVASERAADKFRTALILQSAGVPTVPSTLLLPGVDWSSVVEDELIDSPAGVVVKPVRGMWGDGVNLLRTPPELEAIKDSQPADCPWMLQPFIGDPGYGDVRVFVAGGEAICAMRRVPAQGEWRSNLHKGATGVAHELSDDEADAAVRACGAVGLDIGGVDLVNGSDGPRVLELNSSPGFAIKQITGVDLAGPIAAAVEAARMGRAEVR